MNFWNSSAVIFIQQKVNGNFNSQKATVSYKPDIVLAKINTKHQPLTCITTTILRWSTWSHFISICIHIDGLWLLGDDDKYCMRSGRSLCCSMDLSYAYISFVCMHVCMYVCMYINLVCTVHLGLARGSHRAASLHETVDLRRRAHDLPIQSSAWTVKWMRLECMYRGRTHSDRPSTKTPLFLSSRIVKLFCSGFNRSDIYAIHTHSYHIV